MLKNKIHSFLLFYVYFVAVFYGMITEFNFLAKFDSEIQVVSFWTGVLSFLNSYGVTPKEIRFFVGFGVATFVSSLIASLFSNDLSGRLNFLRLLPILLFFIYTQFKYFLYIGVEYLMQNFMLGIAAIGLLPISIWIGYSANLMAYSALDSDENNDSFEGISCFHFYWLSIPAYYYITQILNAWLSWLDCLELTFKPLIAVIGIIKFVPLVAFCVPAYFGLTVLSGYHLAIKNSVLRLVLSMAIFVIGFFVAIEAIQITNNYSSSIKKFFI